MSKSKDFKYEYLKERIDRDRALFDVCAVGLCKNDGIDLVNLDTSMFLIRRLRESLDILYNVNQDDDE